MSLWIMLIFIIVLNGQRFLYANPVQLDGLDPHSS